MRLGWRPVVGVVVLANYFLACGSAGESDFDENGSDTPVAPYKVGRAADRNQPGAAAWQMTPGIPGETDLPSFGDGDDNGNGDGDGGNNGDGGAEGVGGTTGNSGGTTGAGSDSGGTNSASSGGVSGNTGGANGTTGGTNGTTGGSTNASGGSTNASGGSTNASGGSTNASGGTIGATGGSANASGGTTSASGGTTSASGGTTSASGGTTSASGGTTGASGGASGTTGGSTGVTGGTSGTSGGTSGATGGTAGTTGGSSATGGTGGGSGGSLGATGGTTGSTGGTTASGGSSGTSGGSAGTGGGSSGGSGGSSGSAGSGGTGGGSSKPRSCLDILLKNPASPDGSYRIDPDGSGSIAELSVWCDMTTDGGGWTILYAATGADGEQPLTSDTVVSGAPLNFEHYNTSRALKVALSKISLETLFLRKDSDGLHFLVADHAPFSSALLLQRRSDEWGVNLRADDGTTAKGYMGYANSSIRGGGDFSLSASGFSETACGGEVVNGLDHYSKNYWNTNCDCEKQYLYSLSSTTLDTDAGYDVNLALGSWSSTQTCDKAEGGQLVFRVAVR